MPSSRILMFAGFRSRWTMPCPCAASSASAICLAIGNASVSRSAPCAIRVGERWAVHQLHHQCGDTGELFEAMDVRDIRMVERGQDLRLTSKARQSFGIVRERLRQDFDRHASIQRAVAGFVRLLPCRRCRSTLRST